VPNGDDADFAFRYSIVDVVPNPFGEITPQRSAVARTYGSAGKWLLNDSLQRVTDVFIERRGSFVAVAKPPCARCIQVTARAE